MQRVTGDPLFLTLLQKEYHSKSALSGYKERKDLLRPRARVPFGEPRVLATTNRQRIYSDDLCYKLGGACCQPPVRARPHDGLHLVEMRGIEPRIFGCRPNVFPLALHPRKT